MCEINEAEIAKKYFNMGVRYAQQPHDLVTNKNFYHWHGEEELPLGFMLEAPEGLVKRFVDDAKYHLIRDALEETNQNKGWFQFAVEEATEEEKHRCADDCQRADGMHILHGEAVPREKIIEILRGKPKKIVLDAYIPAEEE